jgi:hypothetical protein
MFDYVGSFKSAIATLERERRYRVFADLERKAGQFPLFDLEQSEWPVADTGTGIGSQELEQIFNPLFTTKSGAWGWVCRSVVQSLKRMMPVVGSPEQTRGRRLSVYAARRRYDSAGASRREPNDLPTSSHL